jgi:hypothetical protein
VLYAGEQQLSFGDRLTALPMAAAHLMAYGDMLVRDAELV